MAAEDSELIENSELFCIPLLYIVPEVFSPKKGNSLRQLAQIKANLATMALL